MGEGGGILTNNDDLAEKIRRLSTHGVERNPLRFINRDESFGLHPEGTGGNAWYYEMQDLGVNGRITDIQCALGISQLRRLGQFKAARQAIVKKYNLALQDLAERKIVLLPPWPEETDPCYHLYPLRLGPQCRIQRDELFERLRGKGIYCQVHYIPIYRQPFYQGKYHFDIGRFPETEKYFATCLSLPLFPGMDEEMVGRVTESIKSMLNPDTIL